MLPYSNTISKKLAKNKSFLFTVYVNKHRVANINYSTQELRTEPLGTDCVPSGSAFGLTNTGSRH